ncbi:MAG: twin-arginine translocase TatA/TatE family subunit [Deltaproteobacteria bacterium]
MRILGMGTQELLLVLLVCLLVFGAAKLPEIGRALGKTIKEFKKSLHEDSEDASKKDDATKA